MNKEDLQKIGIRIAELRKSHRLTQEELAEALGVTVKHISHVERGCSSLSLKCLVTLTGLFSCSLDYIVFGRSADPAMKRIPPALFEAVNTFSEKELLQFRKYLDVYFEMKQNP